MDAQVAVAVAVAVVALASAIGVAALAVRGGRQKYPAEYMDDVRADLATTKREWSARWERRRCTCSRSPNQLLMPTQTTEAINPTTSALPFEPGEASMSAKGFGEPVA